MKLVTGIKIRTSKESKILIHTSVKLVTWAVPGDAVALEYFNPHEREARDDLSYFAIESMAILIHTSVKLVTSGPFLWRQENMILIHTSVKLVTTSSKKSF